MTLARVFLGSLGRRRLATLFSVTAIVLGVALGMAVQIVHESALFEFGRGLRSIAGEADLMIVGPRNGFDENIYALLTARPEVLAASPVVEVETRLVVQQASIQLLGIDFFALGAVSPALLPRPGKGVERYAILREDAVFLSSAAQAALNVGLGDIVPVATGSGTVTLRVSGDIPGSADNRRLAVMDIAAVQSSFGQLGHLTRIDLRLREGVSVHTAGNALQSILPAGFLVETPDTAASQTANLSRAYRVNLTMLAAIALLTGGFLVFSAQALAVVRRRAEFAFLRAIGLQRERLFAWLLGEGAVVGLVGGVVGVIVGHGLAWTALALLGGDLGAGYFSGVKPELRFQPLMTTIYVALGVFAGVAGAWLPAREAATVSPAQALKAGDEARFFEGHGHPLASLVVLLASIPACAIPPIDGLPLGGYLAVALLLAGSVLILPTIAAAIARLLPANGSVPSRLAAARLAVAPGNAVVAAAGVLTSVALAAAMAIMVTSFRDSVDQWLEQVLPADVYLRSARPTAGGYLDQALQKKILALPGAGHVSFTRHESVRLAGGLAPVAIVARPVSRDGHELPLVGAVVQTDASPIWISEAMQDLYGWRPGQHVDLPLGGRMVSLAVAGIWRDYARQNGTVLIDLDAYRQFTGDNLANDAAIDLAPGAQLVQLRNALEALSENHALEIAYPGQIRANSLRVFDRTFAITYLLEAVAVAIGLAGVAASFAALAVVRRREFGMLRHLGVTRRQVGWMLAQEGALAAGVGVFVGLLAGGAIGLILIDVVNRQSFHWSMDLHVPWVSLTAFGTSLVALAALSAVLAGRQAMQQDAVLAVREDW